MFGTRGAVAAPEGRRKRPFQDEETYSMANGLPPKRLCEGFGVLSSGQHSTAGDDVGADLTTTNTQPDASDIQREAATFGTARASGPNSMA
ncbi:hypothetical protein A9Z42_0045230 [Trichoderma parareesei]|uniref:Uncharacterized protein n=1 Tax=Trichoderma parareesei TaxID=858221 RepID=A0A2H2ZXR6_TRIPA|nr:hypothetical protein A9Z42_0045230 [Trichoderma parareesei]